MIRTFKVNNIKSKTRCLGLIVHFDTSEIDFIVPESDDTTAVELYAFGQAVYEFAQCFKASEENDKNDDPKKKYSPSEYN